MTEKAYKNLEDARKKLFLENQSKLPVEDRCDFTKPLCGDKYNYFVCTKPENHLGKHIAYSSLGFAIKDW